MAIDIDITDPGDEGQKPTGPTAHFESMADSLMAIADILGQGVQVQKQQPVDARAATIRQRQADRTILGTLQRMRDQPAAVGGAIVPAQGLAGAAGGAAGLALGGIFGGAPGAAILGMIGAGLGNLIGKMTDRITGLVTEAGQSLFSEFESSARILSRGLAQRFLFGGEKGLLAGISPRTMGFPGIADLQEEPENVRMFREALGGFTERLNDSMTAQSQAFNRWLGKVSGHAGLRGPLENFNALLPNIGTPGQQPGSVPIGGPSGGALLRGLSGIRDLLSDPFAGLFGRITTGAREGEQRRQRDLQRRIQDEQTDIEEHGGLGPSHPSRWFRSRRVPSGEHWQPPPTTQPSAMAAPHPFDYATRSGEWMSREIPELTLDPPQPNYWPSVDRYTT